MFKKLILSVSALALMTLSFNAANAANLPLIGDDAPAFKAQTTQGEINFPSDYKGKWVVLFSHPADFTPVCTSEFITFQSMKDDFDKINTQLVGLSVDNLKSHKAWLKTIKEDVKFNDKENVNVTFPLIDDAKGLVANKYGMLQPNASSTHTVRAVFVIGPQGKVRAILYYPLTNGRNIEEIERLVIALQTSDAFKVATPANWEPGDNVIIPPGSKNRSAVKCNTQKPNVKNGKCFEWFNFKPLSEEEVESKVYINQSAKTEPDCQKTGCPLQNK